jgi:hypothetical protein
MLKCTASMTYYTSFMVRTAEKGSTGCNGFISLYIKHEYYLENKQTIDVIICN